MSEEEFAAPDADATEAEASAQPVFVADEVLLNAADVARRALREITPAAVVGAPAGHIVEGEHVLSLLFETTLPGYPGWFWTVSLSRDLETGDVNVLETELMPGENALLAPEWVPWADRLADYQAQKQAEREAAAAAGEPEPEDDFVAGDELGDEDVADDEVDGDLDAADEDDDFDEVDDDFDESEDLQGVESAALAADEEE